MARQALLLVLASAVVAVSLGITFDYRPTTDTVLNSYQTRALVLHGDLDLTRYEPEQRLSRFGNAVEIDGEVRSIYGPGISVAAAPIYVALARLGTSEGARQGTVSIAYAAVAAAIVLATLVRHFGPRIATAGTVLFVFGTTLWPTGTSALWSHAPALLLLAAGMAALLSAHRGAPALAGLALGLGVWLRPSLIVILAAAAMLYLPRRRALLSFLATAAPLTGGLLLYNVVVWGDIRGGYARSPDLGWSLDVGSSLFGLTLGWWRGLFVYTPVLAFAVVGLVVAVRRRRSDPVSRALVALGGGAAGILLLYAAWGPWWGGGSQYGYRLLLDAAPLLVVLACFAVRTLPRLRAPALALSVLSVAIMIVGAQPNRFGWDFHDPPAGFAEAPLGQALHAVIASPAGALGRAALVCLAALALGAIAGRLEQRVDPAVQSPIGSETSPRR